jgi:hypothetical protein
MTTLVKVFKNRRSAVDLLRKLGRKAYEYDSFIQPTGYKFQVTIQDGNPVSKLAMIVQTEKVAEAMTQAAETVATTIEEAIQSVEAVAATVVSQAPREETPEEREKRINEVERLRRRYEKLEEAAAKKKAKPKKVRKAKPKKKKGPRKMPPPRPPCLPYEKVEEYAKAIKAKTVGPACLELYLAGRTTAEVWLIIKHRFKTPNTHRHYPSWYLCHYRRHGKLPMPEGDSSDR